MIPVCCVDDRGGLLFNGRRQSRDRLLLADLLACARGRPLWISPASKGLFGPELPPGVLAAEAFLTQAGPGDLCLTEGQPLLPHLARIQAVVLYRWNRIYPADVYLDLPLSVPPWRRVRQTDFPGSSHKLITKEIYVP